VTRWIDDPDVGADEYASEEALRERVPAHRALVRYVRSLPLAKDAADRVPELRER
jgi:hypothetical protein